MADEAKSAEAGTNKEEGQPEFGIQRLYIKDLSFEAPNSPAVFLEEWKPELHMDLGTQANRLDDDHHEVVLTVTVNVKMNDKPVFVAEVQYAGIFLIKGFSDDELRPMLGSFCPNVIYPYAREVVTDCVVRGGFPQLYLSPINFDQLYQQHEQEAAAAASEEAAS